MPSRTDLVENRVPAPDRLSVRGLVVGLVLAYAGLTGFAFLADKASDGHAALMILAGFLALVAYFTVVPTRKRAFLRRCSVSIDGSVLSQTGPDDDVVGRVDLGRPWSVRYLHRGSPTAVFQVQQADHTVEFSTDSDGAEEICSEILGIDPRPGPYTDF